MIQVPVEMFQTRVLTAGEICFSCERQSGVESGLVMDFAGLLTTAGVGINGALNIVQEPP